MGTLLTTVFAVAASVSFAAPAGAATCIMPPGDVNGSGAASVTDVQCMVLAALDVLAGGDGFVPCIAGQSASPADLDCDCAILVSDVQLNVAYALGMPLDALLDADSDQCPDACEEANDCSCADDGTPCETKAPCTPLGACQGGVCIAGPPAANGTACNDAMLCTVIDTCSGGVCLGIPYACPDGVEFCDGATGCAECNPLVGAPSRLVNGDAESGPASLTGSEVVPIPGWTTTSNFTVVPWDLGDGWLMHANAGPSDAGLAYFAGGPDTPVSTATQIISLEADAAVVDAGLAGYVLSGYLGGTAGQADNAAIELTFLGSDGGVLYQYTLGPVTAADRLSKSGLVLRSTCGAIPIGARSARVEIRATRVEGGYNDAFADNVRFVLIPDAANACKTDAECADADQCTTDYCDFATFGCVHGPRSCDDGNACTVDQCDPALGCIRVSAGGDCSDGDACTVGDVCVPHMTTFVARSPGVGPEGCLPGSTSPLPGCIRQAYVNPANLALAVPGGALPAVASSVIAGGAYDIHQPVLVNDGAYGNGSSWIGDASTGWVKIDLGSAHTIDRVRLGRDRLAHFGDRSPGRIRIFVALSEAAYANGNDAGDATEYAQVYDSLDDAFNGMLATGATLQARFAATTARYVKIHLQNGEACIDEVEILAAEIQACVSGPPLDCDDGIACTVDSCVDGACSNAPSLQDADDDDFALCDDCNDSDPDMWPGAPPQCNGKDNDCDGIPNDCDCETSGGLDITDSDNDGIPDCLDCAPNDPTVRPGAPEICDGKDNDCDPATTFTTTTIRWAKVRTELGPINGTFFFGNSVTGQSNKQVISAVSLPTGTVLDVEIRAAITHAAGTPAITATIQTPAGITSTLTNHASGGTAFDGTVWDDDAAAPITSGTGKFVGRFRPLSPLGAAVGTASGGSWVLTVSDNVSCCNGSGVVQWWELWVKLQVPAAETDADADGVLACGGDCDDTRGDVRPGLPELCDRLDNDCSGSVPTNELDVDGDGISACELDCNDSNVKIRPGALELCDGLDDDCNGFVDHPNEVDLDNDGYYGCVNDCAPLWPLTHPGAPEICDGNDNNCDGVVPENEVDFDADGWSQCQGDCGPYDNRAHPGNTGYYASTYTNASGFPSYDYNCNGAGEPLLTELGATCIGIFDCTGIGGEGWDGFVPACGHSNMWFGPCLLDCSSVILCLCLSTYDEQFQYCR